MFEEISEFTMVPEYQVGATVFDLLAANSARPIARVRRDENAWADPIWPVLAGPGLDTQVGMVVHSKRRFGKLVAYNAAREPFGSVSVDSIKRHSIGDTWQVEHVGIGNMTGGQVGSSVGAGLRKSSLVDFVAGDIGQAVNDVSRMRMEFRGADGPGFDVLKPAGLAKRAQVTVRDPRIDRILLFAFYILFHDGLATETPKEYIVDSVRAFSPSNWARKKQRP
ncbi:hypothetical protein [Nocardia stercoris]|nr:hypothetical protein [Nocardia stercoris]